MTRRWLQSADVEIDEATGALLVKIGDAELKVDMAEVDVAAIVAGIAGGEGDSATLADLQRAVTGPTASIVHASSGTTPLATSGDAAVEVLAANANAVYHHVRIINEGTAAGFYSIDGGTTWNRLPAQSVVEDNGVKVVNQAVEIKRVAGGSDLSSVYASAW